MKKCVGVVEVCVGMLKKYVGIVEVYIGIVENVLVCWKGQSGLASSIYNI